MALLAWLTRMAISFAAGIGAGCVCFGVMAITGDPELYDFSRMNRNGPPFGPGLLSLGVGFAVFAIVLWLISRKTLSPQAG